jgi:hypothetical protein
MQTIRIPVSMKPAIRETEVLMPTAMVMTTMMQMTRTGTRRREMTESVAWGFECAGLTLLVLG